MKIIFLQDYRGHLTGEEYFLNGQAVDHPNGAALVAAGRAKKAPVKKAPAKKTTAKKAPAKKALAKKAPAKRRRRTT